MSLLNLFTIYLSRFNVDHFVKDQHDIYLNTNQKFIIINTHVTNRNLFTIYLFRFSMRLLKTQSEALVIQEDGMGPTFQFTMSQLTYSPAS